MTEIAQPAPSPASASDSEGVQGESEVIEHAFDEYDRRHNLLVAILAAIRRGISK